MPSEFSRAMEGKTERDVDNLEVKLFLECLINNMLVGYNNALVICVSYSYKIIFFLF